MYEVRLYASNIGGSHTFTFTLTVEERVYYIDIPRTIHGGTVVSATSNPNPFLSVAGQTVTLTAIPDADYALQSLIVVNYDNRNVEIPTTGTGNVRTFTMPAHHVSVVAVFRPSGHVSIVETDNYPSLSAYTQNGILYISGAQEGATLRVYNIPGALIYQGVATTDTAEIPLSGRGIYLVTDGTAVVKVINN